MKGERGRSPDQESPEPADRLMGQARWLGKAVSHGAGYGYVNRIFQRALVADGDKDQLGGCVLFLQSISLS
jgi:hypothetical protein